MQSRNKTQMLPLLNMLSQLCSTNNSLSVWDPVRSWKQPPNGFSKYMFFFPRSNLFTRRVYLFVEQTCFFPGGSICSSNRHVLSRKVYVLRTNMFFPGRSICSSNRHKFSWRFYRTDMFFQGVSICSLNRPYYLIEQILIFQEPLFFHQIDIHFPGSPI